MQTIQAYYDGNVFRPQTPVSVEANTLVEITIQDKIPKKGEHSFLKMAEEAKIEGPVDFAENIDHYLYNDITNSNG